MKFSIELGRAKPTALNLETPTFEELRREREEAQAAADREEARRARQRRFDGAARSRLTHDWTTVSTSANFEGRTQLRVLRARARHLARNNPYVKKFLSLLRNNVAGPAGIKLQARAAAGAGVGLDSVLNRAVEMAWAVWSHPENASVTGKVSWVDAQRKFWTTLGRDGEALVRLVAADNPFGFALKFISVDWLDESYNETLPSGNRVIMSVEVDDDDRPVAYWLTPPPSDLQYLGRGRRTRTRVPAEEIIHEFLIDEATSDDDTQTRGVPMMHAVMERLQMLGGYEGNEVTAARAAACKMGFFEEKEPDEDLKPYRGEDAGGERPPAQFIDHAEPATFGIVPAGYTLKDYDPQHPNTSFGEFVKGALRGIAAGLDCNYFALNQDYGDVNFSSGRLGVNEDRDGWRALQNFQIEHFNRRIFLAWLQASMLTGALRIGPAEYRRLVEPSWRPRGWAGINPLQEANADKVELETGMGTLTDKLAERGQDVEEQLAKRAEELKLAEQKGVRVFISSGADDPEPADASEDEGRPKGKQKKQLSSGEED